MISIGPFQASLADGKVMVIAYTPTDDQFLIVDAEGLPRLVDRLTITVDWRYNAALNTWEDANPSSPLEEILARAKRGLFAIAAYDHAAECPNREDFSIWDCNCNDLKPDVMARMTLDALEEMEDADAPELDGSAADDEAATSDVLPSGGPVGG